MSSPIYDKYIQKSYTFLYPLLGFQRPKPLIGIAPIQTYLRLKGVYNERDGKLLCEFKNDVHSASWTQFQQVKLLNHEWLENVIESPDGSHLIALFDLTEIEEDYQKFLAGKYSQLSAETKRKITSYYGVTTPSWAYVENFLYPEKGIPRYAHHTGVDEKVFWESGGELCPKFDPRLETLTLELSEDAVGKLLSL